MLLSRNASPANEYSEPITAEKEHYCQKRRVHHAKGAKKRRLQRLCWTRTPPPATLFEQALEILSRCSHERFTVHTPQPTQTKTTHPMPVFAFCKEWFNPDLTLASGFFVGPGLLISTHPFQTGFIDTAAEAASLCTGGTLRFEWAMIAVLCISAIAP